MSKRSLIHKLAAAVAAVWIIVSPVAAVAETRVALIIANSHYREDTLDNPPADARLIADALRKSGFTKITVLEDLGRTAMIKALQEFGNDADHSDVALVYYAGHGVEVDHVNYLFPVDAAPLLHMRDVDIEAIKLDTMLAVTENAKRLRIVLLDSCRENPFVSNIRKTSTAGAVVRGMGNVEPTRNSLVVYSAKAGTLSSDGRVNSPFAEALARRIVEPGSEISLMFRHVHDDVVEKTKGFQEPYAFGSLTGQEFYFVPPVVVAAVPSIDIEGESWALCKTSLSRAPCDNYLKSYPAGRYATLVQTRVSDITHSASAAAAAANLAANVAAARAASEAATKAANLAATYAATLAASSPEVVASMDAANGSAAIATRSTSLGIAAPPLGPPSIPAAVAPLASAATPVAPASAPLVAAIRPAPAPAVVATSAPPPSPIAVARVAPPPVATSVAVATPAPAPAPAPVAAAPVVVAAPAPAPAPIVKAPVVIATPAPTPAPVAVAVATPPRPAPVAPTPAPVASAPTPTVVTPAPRPVEVAMLAPPPVKTTPPVAAVTPAPTPAPVVVAAPAPVPVVPTSARVGDLGITVRYDKVAKGIVVDAIDRNAPFVAGKLFLGDLIMKIGATVPDAGQGPDTQLAANWKSDGRLKLLVKRGDSVSMVMILSN